MDLKLNVPLVGQANAYDGSFLVTPGTGLRDGQINACWYASATMVSFYYRPGPRIGLPAVWQANQGITSDPRGFRELARAEGLKALDYPSVGFDPNNLAAMLMLYGPIWAAGYYSDYGPGGHAIVLTGVQGANVLYNDPAEPKAKSKSITWLMTNAFRFRYSLMIKDRTRS